MITLATKTIRNTLNAMYYNFSPYLYNKEIEESWVTDLIDAYNQIINEMSEFELQEVNSGLYQPHEPIFY